MTEINTGTTPSTTETTSVPVIDNRISSNEISQGALRLLNGQASVNTTLEQLAAHMRDEGLLNPEAPPRPVNPTPNAEVQTGPDVPTLNQIDGRINQLRMELGRMRDEGRGFPQQMVDELDSLVRSRGKITEQYRSLERVLPPQKQAEVVVQTPETGVLEKIGKLMKGPTDFLKGWWKRISPQDKNLWGWALGTGVSFAGSVALYHAMGPMGGWLKYGATAIIMNGANYLLGKEKPLEEGQKKGFVRSALDGLAAGSTAAALVGGLAHVPGVQDYIPYGEYFNPALGEKHEIAELQHKVEIAQDQVKDLTAQQAQLDAQINQWDGKSTPLNINGETMTGDAYAEKLREELKKLKVAEDTFQDTIDDSRLELGEKYISDPEIREKYENLLEARATDNDLKIEAATNAFGSNGNEITKALDEAYKNTEVQKMIQVSEDLSGSSLHGLEWPTTSEELKILQDNLAAFDPITGKLLGDLNPEELTRFNTELRLHLNQAKFLEWVNETTPIKLEDIPKSPAEFQDFYQHLKDTTVPEKWTELQTVLDSWRTNLFGPR